MSDPAPGRGKRRVRRHPEELRQRALQVIASTGGNLSAAARILQVDVSLLHRWQKAARCAAATAEIRAESLDRVDEG